VDVVLNPKHSLETLLWIEITFFFQMVVELQSLIVLSLATGYQ
jgi:hypothetical protein